ncbi:hypothetical protein MC885_017351, partial [Smutsia gigantea]
SLLFSPAAAPKSVISLHPPWTTVFKGQRVNLTCNRFHICAPEKITWYHGNYWNKNQIETLGNSLEVHDSGEYRCQAPGWLQSNPVRLFFSSDYFILQAPYSVFEGDKLVLRCQSKGKERLSTVKYTWNGRVISDSNTSRNLLIPLARSNNSGSYQCIGSTEENYIIKSNIKIIQIQELFPRPKLKVTASQPTEGNSVNLSCETQLPLERSDTLLHFIFFRDKEVTLNWSRSPAFQITTIWREDSGWYWCGAETVTHSVCKHSHPLQVHVQRIPASGVLLEIQSQGSQVTEGETLVLVCSVAEGTGNTTFSWYREDTGEDLGRKSQRSQRAELEILAVRESHVGRYYCTADNGHGLLQSEPVNITVRRECFLGDTKRSPPIPGPGDPALVDLQLLYSNAHLKEEDLVYSEIQIIQQGDKGEASTSKTSLEDKQTSVVYAEVKTQLPHDSAGKVSNKDEDDMDTYENVLLV